MKRRMCAAFILMWVSTGWCAAAAAQDADGEGREKLPIDIEAARLEYVKEQLIGSGDVVIRHDAMTLKADYASFHPETGVVYARGNVEFTRGDLLWQGEEIRYNLKEKTGDFGRFSMEAGKYHITAGGSERVSERELLLRDVMFTPCEGTPPTISVHAREARLIDRHLIKVRHGTFRVRNMPVMYLPYLKRDLEGGVYNFSAGESGDWGPYALNTFTYNPHSNVVAKTHADAYARRGLGFGQDLRWGRERGEGNLSLYYINDSEPQDDDHATEEYLNESKRYRIHLRHLERLSDYEYAAARLDYWSDPDVVDDFFDDEFRSHSRPENYLAYSWSGRAHTLGARVDAQLNDFEDRVERLPEIALDLYRRPVTDLPLVYRSETEGAYLARRYPGGLRTPVPDDYHSWRLDSAHFLESPQKLYGFLNVIPRAGYRATVYSDTAGGDGDIRHLGELGVLSSFKAYKVLSERERFYGDGLRHLAEPYADYVWRPTPNLRPGDLDLPQDADIYEFDHIDELDEAHDLRFGIRNKLQTRRNGRVEDVLDVDFGTVYRIEPETGEEDYDTLFFHAEFDPVERIHLESDFEYDWYTHEYSPFNARAELMTTDDSRLDMEYRYRENEHDLFEAELNLFPNETWSLGLVTRYDRDEEEWDENGITVRRRFDCVGLGMGYRRSQHDHQIFAYFWVLEFGDTSPRLGI
ncbi:LPS-assembly protein LptD [Kiritimatiella glycovorans]|uniref:Organic solvent tolerance protein n=1 Tax=Kiritimatiella glycovorans TaxID=1307763 RepID=A0A0G3EIT9_9BACT|nr:LPS assembly protein LptD [Kiritimatiella glycovorans]AKJ64084.1 Organic solvent tolerance protein [Kiritimatiella glycovorans]